MSVCPSLILPNFFRLFGATATGRPMASDQSIFQCGQISCDRKVKTESEWADSKATEEKPRRSPLDQAWSLNFCAAQTAVFGYKSARWHQLEARRRIAAMLRSTSVSVVAHGETLIRIAV